MHFKVRFVEYFTASVFKRELRKAPLKVQQGPVGITKNRKLIAVLVSVQTYDLLQQYKDHPLFNESDPGINDTQE